MEHSSAKANRFLHRHHPETGKRLVPLTVSFGLLSLALTLVVRSCLEIAHNLNLTVVAEGVERSVAAPAGPWLPNCSGLLPTPAFVSLRLHRVDARSPISHRPRAGRHRVIPNGARVAGPVSGGGKSHY
jgi:hypothetical protein